MALALEEELEEVMEPEGRALPPAAWKALAALRMACTRAKFSLPSWFSSTPQKMSFTKVCKVGAVSLSVLSDSTVGRAADIRNGEIGSLVTQ